MTTATTDTLRLHRGDDDEGDGGPLRFERRSAERSAADGVAVVHELVPHFGRRHDLRLRDRSPCGLSGVCADALVPGTDVVLDVFGGMSAPQRGTVVRCRPCGHGYEVAIEIALRRAA